MNRDSLRERLSVLGINYVAERTRHSPLNVAVARALVGLYLAWKLLSYDWAVLSEWPVYSARGYGLLVSDLTLSLAPVTALVLAALSVVFALGYRLRPVSFLLALGVAHLALHRYALNPSGGTESFYIAVFFVVLFGLFAREDALSVDGIRRTATRPLSDLNASLQEAPDRTFSMGALTWSLVVLAIVYFGSGLAKVIRGPGLEWIQGETISRYVTHRAVYYGRELVVGELIVETPLLSTLAAVGTIALEVGFLVAVVLGLAVAPFVVGLAGMHAVVVLAIGPFFFDMFVFLGCFLGWDRLFERLTADRSLTVVYDDRNHRCARLLYACSLLDSSGTVSFVPRRTAADRNSPEGGPPDSAMYAVVEDCPAGYHALREIARQFPIFRLLAWLGGRGPMATLGARVFEVTVESPRLDRAQVLEDEAAN